MDRPEVKDEIDQYFEADHADHRIEQDEAAGHEVNEQQGKGGQAVDRLQRIGCLDREHEQAEPVEGTISDHVAIPILGLQKATEPPASLAQESADGTRRIGPGAGRADDTRGPPPMVEDAVTAQS